jgi:uncharacterized protein
MKSTRIAVTLLAALIALIAGGCGDDDSDTTTTTGATGATGASGESGAEAGTGAVPPDGPPDPDLTVAEVAEQLPLPDHVTNDQGFNETVDIFIASSHKFWSEALDEIGEPYHLPDEFIAYDGAAGDEGPDCGGAPAGVQNAAYCRVPAESDHGIITFDETGLLKPLFEDLGDGSTAFIIGHEFAHLVQDRLGLIQKYPLTVEKELAADCLTGAYLGGFGAAGVEYTKEDMRSIQDGISIVGDAPGTPWQDEHAHGNAEERQAAFFTGFENDAATCLEEFKPGFSG